MAANTGGFRRTLLSLSLLAVLAGCGGSGTTENPVSPPGAGSNNPGSNDPGSNDPGTNPGANPDTDPGTGTNPGTVPNTPNPPNPPTNAIGETATANANTAVLTTTRTQVYTLNAPALSNGGWQAAQVLEEEHLEVTSARVAFDAAGNGFAAWTQGSDMIVRSYNAATSSWSAPAVLDASNEDAYQARVVIDSETGNALAAWTQSDGTAPSLYVSRYNVFSNTWGAPELLEHSDDPVITASENSFVATSGSHAAVAWRQYNGAVIDIYLSRLVNGSWSTPAVVDSYAQPALHPEVGIDPNGNATVVWRQAPTTDDVYHIYGRRWDNSTQAFSPVEQMSTAGDRQPRLRFDAAGNGILLWGNGAYVRHFDAASGAWSAEITVQNQSDDAWAGEVAVAENGDALAAWVEYDGAFDSVYARRYDAATNTWGNAVLLETMSGSANIDVFPTASLRGSEGVVAWVHNNAISDVYGVKLSNGVFGPATLLETRNESPSELSSAVDAAGNASVVWIQRLSITEARFATANLVVPNGATWQSLAHTLYGVNALEAGLALQAAMGGGQLTGGMILSGFPTSLTVTTPIPAFYTVLATDTWAHVAQTVYGVTDVAAITRLRDALGNPTLTAGLQLVVPSVIQYTTTADYSAPLNWSLVNTTATTYHQLDLDALVFPMDSWSPATTLEPSGAEASSPQVAFDANGNGVAVWAQASDVIARRYVASTDTWSAPVVLDSNPADALWPRLAVDRTTGDAMVSWAQSDGSAVSMYVSNFDAGSNTWSTALSIETGAFDVSENGAMALVGEHAAATWVQSDGTAINVYMSRLVAGTWTAPALLDTSEQAAQQSVVAIDSNGNTIVLWRQREAGGVETRIYARRWDNNSQSFGTITALNSDGERFPRIAFDAQGNGFATWWGGGVFARRYDATTNTWSSQVSLHNGDPAAWRAELAVDANGDALVSWVEHDGTAASMYARYFDAHAGTWGNAVLLENSNDDVSIDVNTTVSLVNGGGVVAWVSFNSNNEQGVHAARFGNGVWSTPTLLENRQGGSSQLISHIDGNNNATVLWLQGSLYYVRSNGTPYYIVPAGATWQSIANTLYGVDSTAAADALRTAMSNPTLTTGLHLPSPPATLVLTPAVPTYYVVQSGDTWQSITLALYGASATEAATALWNGLGQPVLTVGQQLVIPSTLEYTVEED